MSVRIGSRARCALFAAAALAAFAAGCGAIAPSTAPSPSSPPAPIADGPRERSVNFTLAGTVVQVEDGDTLTLVAAKDARFVVRLSDFDAPEIFHRRGPDRACPGRMLPDRPGQPLGRAARDSLASLAAGRQARAECYEIDRFGRPVCHVFVAGANVNLAQIERGWGMLSDRPDWVRDPASRTAEAQARSRGAGVWAAADPVHPGTWREQCWGRGECTGADS